jgi:hypothetical protein
LAGSVRCNAKKDRDFPDLFVQGASAAFIRTGFALFGQEPTVNRRFQAAARPKDRRRRTSLPDRSDPLREVERMPLLF